MCTFAVCSAIVFVNRTGHMLTHQKRKLFHCSEPGCQRSYCDAHSLKRHCLSQHGAQSKPTPSGSASTHSTLHPTAHWEARADDAPCAAVQSSSDQSSYPTIYISAPKTVTQTDTPSVGSNYHSYVNSNNYKAFSTVVRGLGVSQYTSEGTSKDRPLVCQDQWIPEGTKSVYGMSRDEAVPSQDMQGSTQWHVNLEPELSTVSASEAAAAQTYGADSLSGSCWENALEFPVTDLQALDSILSFQSSQETASCQTEERPVSLEHSKQNQHAQINISLSQVKKVKSEPLPWPISGQDFNKTVDCPLPALQPQLSILEEMHAVPKVENVKKRVRKRKIITDDGLPLPIYNDESVSRRPRTRPGFLISPSQVAMASFSSDSAPYLSLKVCVYVHFFIFLFLWILRTK